MKVNPRKIPHRFSVKLLAFLLTCIMFVSACTEAFAASRSDANATAETSVSAAQTVTGEKQETTPKKTPAETETQVDIGDYFYGRFFRGGGSKLQFTMNDRMEIVTSYNKYTIDFEEFYPGSTINSFSCPIAFWGNNAPGGLKSPVTVMSCTYEHETGKLDVTITNDGTTYLCESFLEEKQTIYLWSSSSVKLAATTKLSFRSYLGRSPTNVRISCSDPDAIVFGEPYIVNTCKKVHDTQYDFEADLTAKKLGSYDVTITIGYDITVTNTFTVEPNLFSIAKSDNSCQLLGKEGLFKINYDYPYHFDKGERPEISVDCVPAKNAGDWTIDKVSKCELDEQSGILHLIVNVPGKYTITAKSPDKRTASCSFDAEPEIIPVGMKEGYVSGGRYDVYRVKIGCAGKKYLESFIAGLTVAFSEKVLRRSDRQFVVSSDNRSISENWKFETVTGGTEKITVRSPGGQSVDASLTIPKATQKMTAVPASFDLKTGKTTALTVRNAVGKITRKSSDPTVATFDEDGNLIGHCLGKSTITVTAAGNEYYNSKTVTFEVKVTVPTVIASGVFDEGNGPSWTLDNSGTLNVTGMGEIDHGSTLDYKDYIRKIIIHEPESMWDQVWINAGAFENFDRLSEIVFPEQLTTIENYAFHGCTSLTSVTLPENLYRIGDSIFWGCTSLKEIKISESNAMFSCEDGILYSKKKDILYCCPAGKDTQPNLPNSVKEIKPAAFRDCCSLEKIILPDSVKIIGGNAFTGCNALKEIVIPDSVEEMGSWMFSDCTSLKKAVLPEGLKSVGSGMFESCSSLKDVWIPDSVTAINYASFSHCSSLPFIELPKKLNSIGVSAFQYCDSLTGIVIPHPVTFISSYAFYDSIHLHNVYYTGTQEQWNGITISSYNESLLWADIQYQYVSDSETYPVVFLANGGTGAPSKQYKKKGSALTLSSVKPFMKSMTFVCWNTKPDGTGTSYQPGAKYSQNTALTLYAQWQKTPDPVIAENVTAKVNESVSFSVKAQGDGLTYQWYYKKAGQTAWNKWGARTTATTTATANATWDGMQVYCKVTDKHGNSMDSNTATIKVTQPLKITAQPTGKTIKSGNSLTVSLKAEGIGLSYQWYFKKSGQTSFTAWNGRTHASETVTPPANWNGIQLYCKVSDSNENSLQSNIIKITVTN